jgi:hypothetical protein
MRIFFLLYIYKVEHTFARKVGMETVPICLQWVQQTPQDHEVGTYVPYPL